MASKMRPVQNLSILVQMAKGQRLKMTQQMQSCQAQKEMRLWLYQMVRLSILLKLKNPDQTETGPLPVQMVKKLVLNLQHPGQREKRMLF